MQVAFMLLDGPERTQELLTMGTQTSGQHLISKGKPGPSEPAPTSSPCRMDDVWTENIFSLYSCPIANHSVYLCVDHAQLATKSLTFLPFYVGS
jgi:hypothetical protein